MDYVYDSKNQAQIEAYVNYVTPVAGTKEIMLEQDPDLAKNQLIFPDDEFTAKCDFAADDHGRGGAERSPGPSTPSVSG